MAKDEGDEEEAWRHLAREVSSYRAEMLAKGVAASEAEQRCETLAMSVIEDAEWISYATQRLIAARLDQRREAGTPAWKIGSWRSIQRELGFEIGRRRLRGWSDRLEALLHRRGDGQ